MFLNSFGLSLPLPWAVYEFVSYAYKSYLNLPLSNVLGHLFVYAGVVKWPHALQMEVLPYLAKQIKESSTAWLILRLALNPQRDDDCRESDLFDWCILFLGPFPSWSWSEILDPEIEAIASFSHVAYANGERWWAPPQKRRLIHAHIRSVHGCPTRRRLVAYQWTYGDHDESNLTWGWIICRQRRNGYDSLHCAVVSIMQVDVLHVRLIPFLARSDHSLIYIYILFNAWWQVVKPNEILAIQISSQSWTRKPSIFWRSQYAQDNPPSCQERVLTISWDSTLKLFKRQQKICGPPKYVWFAIKNYVS